MLCSRILYTSLYRVEPSYCLNKSIVSVFFENGVIAKHAIFINLMCYIHSYYEPYYHHCSNEFFRPYAIYKTHYEAIANLSTSNDEGDDSQMLYMREFFTQLSVL